MEDKFSRVRQPKMIYADHAAMTQLPDVVIKKLREGLERPRANAWRGLYGWAEAETARLEGARERILKLSGLQGYGVRFNRGVTSGLNGIARAFADQIPNLRVACSPLEHQANLLSWQKVASEVRILPWTEAGLDMGRVEQILSGVGVLAVTATSNITGETLPIRELVKIAKMSGVRVVVDASQFTPHSALPADGWGADMIVTSGHKMYGPIGLGVTFMALEGLDLEPSVWGGGMVEVGGWEAGTWSTLEAVALAEAWEFVGRVDDSEAWRAVAVVEGVVGSQILKPRGERVAPMVSYVPKGHPHDVVHKLGQAGLMGRAGQLCAPLGLQAYGVSGAGVVRLSFGAMTNKTEVEMLEEILNNHQDL